MQNSITALDFSQLVRSGKRIELIDVRTPVEFQEIHVDFARNIPLDRLDPGAIQAARGAQANDPLYIVCRSGARGRQACEKFKAAGYHHVVNVEGGTSACATAGVPITHGKKMAVPLHCQVQIITGAIVMIGAALALRVNPYWVLIPVGMGAGLVFSGLTNTCAMGAMLARMPWNHVPTPTPTSSNISKDKSCQAPNGGCCK